MTDRAGSSPQALLENPYCSTRRTVLLGAAGLLASPALGSDMPDARRTALHVDTHGLTFPVLRWGSPGGEPVLLLHGFPQSAETFDPVARMIADAGFSVYAFDQRGYAPTTLPHDGDYSFDTLCRDAIAVADALKLGRFHLSGFGLGALLGWMITASHPERVRSFVPLRYPHPAAFAWGLVNDPEQKAAWEQTRVQIASVPPAQQAAAMLKDEAAGLRAFLARSGLKDPILSNYVARLRTPGLLAGALSWQPGMSVAALSAVQPVRRPTCFLWSVGPALVPSVVTRTQQYVHAEYHIEELPGVGHFFLENAPEIAAPRMTRWLVAHR